MTLILKYDLPISDYDVIKAGTELEIDPTWNEYEGFIAVRYRGGSLYFNALYFEEMPALIEVI